MRNAILIMLFFQALSIWSQTNTEVYLFDITKKEDTIELANQRNISNNDGYNNQPSFVNDSLVVFSSTRNKQTDIAAYNIITKKVNWICNTKIGSEYSPIQIPNQQALSAIRLDTTGKQLLYQYDYSTGVSKVLVENLVIGYHTWYNNNILVSSVIQDDYLSLVVTNLSTTTNTTIHKKIGRSLHKIPNTDLISYISKESEHWEIRSLNPTTGETKKINNTIPNTEDMCWLPDGTILMSKENVLYRYNPKADTSWNVFYSFKNKNIIDISRIQTNKAGTLLALVSEITK